MIYYILLRRGTIVTKVYCEVHMYISWNENAIAFTAHLNSVSMEYKAEFQN